MKRSYCINNTFVGLFSAAPLLPTSPSLLLTDGTRVPADLDMQLQPSSATTAKISLLQQLTEYGEVDSTLLGRICLKGGVVLLFTIWLYLLVKQMSFTKLDTK